MAVFYCIFTMASTRYSSNGRVSVKWLPIMLKCLYTTADRGLK